MDGTRAFGMFTSLLTLVGLIYLLALDSQEPVILWPYEAFQGLVFTLGWGFGVPEKISYLVAGILVVVLLTACYLLGHKFARCILSLKRNS